MRSVRVNLILAVGLSAFLFVITGCKGDIWALDKEEPKYPCKVLGACDASIMKMAKKLNKKGVQVFTVGQDYMISIPASYLFESESPRIKWKSYALLNEIASFLKQFRKIAINIASYSNKYGSPEREHALTLARSRVVSDYLWSQVVDSRLIFTQGLGSDKPIIAFTQGGDNSINARVEITFRRAVA
ncbi:MAG: type IVB secretion system protein IcmN/DotK [Legionella sp.]